MEPTVVTCSGACTVTHVISINVPPFNLSEAEGAAISGAVLLVWVVGWGYRALVRMIRETDGASTSEEA